MRASPVKHSRRVAPQQKAGRSAPALAPVISVFIAAIFFRCLTLLPVSIDVDEAWYAASAANLTTPLDFFMRAADNKPPGTVWFFWLVQWLSHAGSDPRVARAAFLLITTACAGILGRAVSRVVGRKAGWIAAALFLLTSALPGPDTVSTNAEGLIALVLCALMVASFEALTLPKPSSAWRWALLGVASGFAVLCKQTAVFVAASGFLSLLFLWRRGRARGTSVVAYCMSTTFVVVVAAGLLGWRDFAYWTLVYPLTVLHPARAQMFANSPLIVHVAAYAVLFWPLLYGLRASLLKKLSVQWRTLFLIWMIPGVAVVAVGKGVFFHYFVFLSPPLCFLSAQILSSNSKFAESSLSWLLGVHSFICLAVAVPALGLLWGSDLRYYERVGKDLRELTAEKDQVFVWGGNALPLVMSNRLHVTRFATARFLMSPYTTSTTQKWFREDFKAAKPTVVVDLHERGDERFRLPLERLPWLHRELRRDYVAYRDPLLPWAVFYLEKAKAKAVSSRFLLGSSPSSSSPVDDLQLLLGASGASWSERANRVRHWRSIAVLQSLLRCRDALRRLATPDARLAAELEQAIARQTALDEAWVERDRVLAEQTRELLVWAFQSRNSPLPLSLDSWTWWVSVALVKFQPVASQDHPLSLLEQIGLPEGARFEFSKYVYVPQAVSEKRTVYQVPVRELRAQFEAHVLGLEPLEEIAFHSRLLLADGTETHLPMLDMGCEDFSRHLGNLKAAFADFGIARFTVFSSGRSFHIYGHEWLAAEQVVRFMGRMLLLNLPGKEHVIDERWVGHRLMAGYLTLRWTKNNPHYVSSPVRVAEYCV